jgi:CubicO group peptidase (beta-lactamase class C family)
MKNLIVEKINEFMDMYCKTWAFSGSILVSQKGQTIFKKGYGFASQEYNIPNTAQTKHRICSITKQFTAMAIMILQERGLLNVHDKANKYLPEYKELDERITIHHLLTHTSGLQYLFGSDFEKSLNNPKHKHEYMINIFRDLPLLCEPGQAWNYSNFGYYLLGCIIENVSGISYDEFFQQNIFKPLNMNDTGVERDKKIIHGLATGYYLNGDEIIRHKYMNIDLAFAGGDIYSTVEDMLLWDKALYTEKLVSKKTLDLIFTPYANSRETGNEDNDYGYGWFIVKKHGRDKISHDGGGLGFITDFNRYVNEEISIVVLSNYGFTAVWRISEIIAAILFQEEYSFPSKPQQYSLEPGLYESYMGTYKDDILKLDVKQEDGKMFFVIDEEYVIPIFPISKNRFHHCWIDESYTFSKDENGNIQFWGLNKIDI